jgi:peroxin-2
MNGSMVELVSNITKCVCVRIHIDTVNLVESIAKDAPLTQTQKIAYGVLTVGGQYIWSRANRYITAKGWGELDESDHRNKIYRVLQTGEKYWKAFSLVNFLVFLWNGRYRTLIDRMLAMRLVYSKKSMNRQVSFEFLNRQMVWHAFTVSKL